MLIDLYKAAAEKITGQPVKVDFVDCLPDGYLGKVHKSNGVFIIRVLQGGSYAGELTIFLHECAYVRLQAHEFEDMGDWVPESIPQSKTLGGDKKQNEYSNDEYKADKLAACWLLFADWHAWRFDGSRTEQVLQALIHADKLT